MSKYYVVWHGRQPGIYTSWPECEQQVKGCPGARFKSFKTQAEAELAYSSPPPPLRRASRPATTADDATDSATPTASKPTTRKRRTSRKAGAANAMPINPPDWRNDTVLPLPPEVTADAWAVDAACSGNPGAMEYRGVDLATGEEVFHLGPAYGTNNIGEFLAIVHALALMKQRGLVKTIYSDSRNAQLWVKARRCRTTLKPGPRTSQVLSLVARAEAWLKSNEWSEVPIVKWQTDQWGEIPADFGRK